MHGSRNYHTTTSNQHSGFLRATLRLTPCFASHPRLHQAWIITSTCHREACVTFPMGLLTPLHLRPRTTNTHLPLGHSLDTTTRHLQLHYEFYQPRPRTTNAHLPSGRLLNIIMRTPQTPPRLAIMGSISTPMQGTICTIKTTSGLPTWTLFMDIEESSIAMDTIMGAFKTCHHRHDHSQCPYMV